MGVSENSIAPNLASRPYLKYVQIEKMSDVNLLDFPDSFSILTREFEVSDRSQMEMLQYSKPHASRENESGTLVAILSPPIEK